MRVKAVDARERLGIGDGPLLLAVSAMKSHKNLLRLVRALAHVRERFPDAALVVPGNRTPYEQTLREEAERLGIAAGLWLPGFVDEATLEGLYAAATLSVFPSLQEGFGLPVLEAMARGVPVACSRIAVLQEVGAEAARYFDPRDEQNMGAVLTELVADAGARARMAELGRERAAAFSWRGTAEGTLESYERALAARRRA
jgi:glycosyltransferase involved in cell wall biosynthesis